MRRQLLTEEAEEYAGRRHRRQMTCQKTGHVDALMS